MSLPLDAYNFGGNRASTCGGERGAGIQLKHKANSIQERNWWNANAFHSISVDLSNELRFVVSLDEQKISEMMGSWTG